MSQSLPFDGVLLDMDGLLLDTERVAERCWHAAEVETGFSMPEGFYFTLIGQTLPLIERRLIEVMSPECDIPGFLQVAKREYDRALREEAIPVKDGAREFLAFLVAQSIPACLATSTFRELAKHKLEASGLLPLLPLRVCGDDVRHSKPAPDIYLLAAEKLGSDPSRLIVLEDSENGIVAALAAGCRVLHVPDIAPVALDVQARADRIYRNLREVKAAIARGELQLVADS